MSATRLPAPGTVIGGKYRLGEILGRGGMGTVFHATHEVTGRPVALKWVPQEATGSRDRLMREARSLGRVSHPNVVEVLDAGEEDGAVYLVTSFVSGINLRTFARRRPLDVEEAVDILLPVFAGVGAAHHHGVVHRDLKPENLIVAVDDEGRPLDTKVLDFGVAKLLVAENSLVLTRTGRIVGTPSYMAPEQLLGEPAISARTDVYALGVLLFELLTGHLPYEAKDFRDLAREIVVGNLPKISALRPDLDPRVSQIVERALQFEVKDRFGSVAEMQQELLPFGSGRVSPSAIPSGIQSDVITLSEPAPSAALTATSPPPGKTTISDPPPETSASSGSLDIDVSLQHTMVDPSVRAPSFAKPATDDTLESVSLPQGIQKRALPVWLKVAGGAAVAGALVAFGWIQGAASTSTEESPPIVKSNAAAAEEEAATAPPKEEAVPPLPKEPEKPRPMEEKQEKEAELPQSPAPVAKTPAPPPQAKRKPQQKAPQKEGVETSAGVLRADDF